MKKILGYAAVAALIGLMFSGPFVSSAYLPPLSLTDESTFTFGGVGAFANGGGFFQTTSTANALTNGQQGAFQLTANRALFVDLRNAAGTEVGTSSTPLQMSLANTGSNGTPLQVSLANTGSNATPVAVSAASLPLPTGAATDASLQALVGCAGQTLANTNVTSINNAASSTSLKLVTKVAAKNVYICAINIGNNAANNVALVEGTQTTTQCDTATAGMAGGTTAATGWSLGANGGLTQGNGQGMLFKTATVNHDVCLLFSAASQVSGTITWSQF